ncbi:MAG: helix-hairpin-helix domain-containing protein, partial [Pseudomonadota bacterium]|nr:helix-hairpin-helix domain-containing protein [Pseudomonadota bacterium]
YRSRTLDILISTGTLEMGVNLPARLVVLYDLQGFNGLDFVPLSVNTVWQRAGRAGRRGLDDAGDVLLIAPTWAKGIERYLRGDFENIQSQLGSEAALAEQVVIEVASGLVKNQTQLHRCFDSTLAKHQQRLGDLDSVLREMLEAGMLANTLKKGRTCLEATGLGRIAVRQMLRPRTVVSLSRRLRSDSAQDFTFLDLLLIAIGTSDCQPKLPTDFEELDGLSDLLGQERSILLEGSTASVLKRFHRSGRHLLDTIKTALVIRAWTRTGDVESVAEDFGCYSFEIRRLVESLERILSAAVAVLSPSKDEAESVVLDEEDVPIRERIQALREMVAYGIHEEAVSLTGIDGIGGKLARRLLRIGITDIEDMAQAEAEDVAMVQGISLKRASSLIEEANRVMGKRSAFYFRETGPTIRSVSSEWLSSI